MSQRSRRRVCLCHYPHNWAPIMSHSAGLLPTFSVTWPDNSNMPRPFFFLVFYMSSCGIWKPLFVCLCACVWEKESVWIAQCLFIDYCVKRFDLPFIYSLLMNSLNVFFRDWQSWAFVWCCPRPLPVFLWSHRVMCNYQAWKSISSGNGLCQ